MFCVGNIYIIEIEGQIRKNKNNTFIIDIYCMNKLLVTHHSLIQFNDTTRGIRTATACQTINNVLNFQSDGKLIIQ